MKDLVSRLSPGEIFTGRHFTGRVEIISIDYASNILRVKLTKDNGTSFSDWNEDWNLQHTLWGFEQGEYFYMDFPDFYPQTYYSGPIYQNLLKAERLKNIVYKRMFSTTYSNIEISEFKYWMLNRVLRKLNQNIKNSL